MWCWHAVHAWRRPCSSIHSKIPCDPRAAAQDSIRFYKICAYCPAKRKHVILGWIGNQEKAGLQIRRVQIDEGLWLKRALTIRKIRKSMKYSRYMFKSSRGMFVLRSAKRRRHAHNKCFKNNINIFTGCRLCRRAPKFEESNINSWFSPKNDLLDPGTFLI